MSFKGNLNLSLWLCVGHKTLGMIALPLGKGYTFSSLMNCQYETITNKETRAITELS